MRPAFAAAGVAPGRDRRTERMKSYLMETDIGPLILRLSEYRAVARGIYALSAPFLRSGIRDIPWR